MRNGRSSIQTSARSRHGRMMFAELPLWIVAALSLQVILVVCLMVAEVVTQRRRDQAERLLEQLILGTESETRPEAPGKPKRPRWQRLFGGG
ncbi:MAG: hypothetical protein M3380_05190 [Chloroflexota bacterium]|nr:hypothetical protein [Chloroflexota bacterium]